jgi:hypothetical protein
MSRAQFLALLVGSLLVLLALVLQVTFSIKAQGAQRQVVIAQQTITTGRDCDVRLQQLATRIYQVGTQYQDQALKDLLVRQNIAVKLPPNAAPTQPNTGATLR